MVLGLQGTMIVLLLLAYGWCVDLVYASCWAVSRCPCWEDVAGAGVLLLGVYGRGVGGPVGTKPSGRPEGKLEYIVLPVGGIGTIDGVMCAGDGEYDEGGGGNGRSASAGLRKYGRCPDGVTCDMLDGGREGGWIVMLTVPDDDELIGRVESRAGDLVTGLAEGAFCGRICSLDERGAGIATCTKPASSTSSSTVGFMLRLLGVLCSRELVTSGMTLSTLDDRGCSGGLSRSSSDVLVEATLSVPDALRRTVRWVRGSETGTEYNGAPGDRGSGTISTGSWGRERKGVSGLE
jgi:hypothetical protein